MFLIQSPRYTHRETRKDETMDVDERKVNLVRIFSRTSLLRRGQERSTAYCTYCWLILEVLSVSFSLVLLTLLSSQISKDGDSFTVPLAVAKMSELVKGMMEGENINTFGVAAAVFRLNTPNAVSLAYSLACLSRRLSLSLSLSLSHTHTHTHTHTH